MNVYRALVAAMIGLVLLPAHDAVADNVLYRVQLVEPLSPMLRRMVVKEFPQDPELKKYLSRELCQSPPSTFAGAIVPLNPEGDLGAIITITGGCGVGGSMGSPLYIFLKQHGKWVRAGDTFFSGYYLDVLRRIDHGYYRLDLGEERDCSDKDGRTMETDGIMVWKGKTYDRLHPCP